jgi:citrate synthase
MAAEIIPGLAGVPVTRSAISFIDGDEGILEYRSIPIQTLLEAPSCNYLETAYLLLNGTFPDSAELQRWEQLIAQHRAREPEIIATLRALPKNGHPMEALVAGVAALGMLYAETDRKSGNALAMATIRLLAKFPSIVATFHRLRKGLEPLAPKAHLDHAGNFLWMLRGQEPTELERKVLDTVLIVHADHTLNASTFAARVAISTLPDIYMVATAAIATLSGPLHGGATEAVLVQLQEIGEVSNVRPWMEKKMAKKEKVMGLGHRVYKVKDPRAPILQKLADKLFREQGRTKLYDVALELEVVGKEFLGHKGIYPNVDFFSGLVYEKIGITTDLFTPMFAVGRICGWLAHVHEQLKENHLYRPEQIYTGTHDQPYLLPKNRQPITGSLWSKLLKA